MAKKPGRLSFLTKALKSKKKPKGKKDSGGGLKGFAKGYVASSIVDALFGGKAEESVIDDAMGATSNDKDTTTSSNKSVVDFPDLQKVKVADVIIKPKLGPLEGKYARHLNLIIERQAKVESAVRTQNNLINKYNSLVSSAIEQNRKESLAQRRRDDEAELENKRGHEKTQSSIAGLRRTISDKSDGLLRTLGKIALGGAAGFGLYNYAVGNIKPSGTDILDTAIAGIEAVDQGITTFTDTVVPGITSAAGAKKGTQIGKNANAARRTFDTKGVKPQGLSDRMKLAGLRAADVVQKPVGMQLNPGMIKEGMRGTKGGTRIDMQRRYERALKFRQNLAWLEKFFVNMQKMGDKFDDWWANTSKFLPDGLVTKLDSLGKKLVKWYLIGESFVFMYRASESFALGQIGEKEWHEGNKEQINRIFMALGGAYATALIFGLAGTSIGGPYGTLLGGFGGFVAGLFFGDDVYRLLQLDDLVDALYDGILGDKTFKEAMAGFAAKVGRDFISSITGGDDDEEDEKSVEDRDIKSELKGTSTIGGTTFAVTSGGPTDMELKGSGQMTPEALVQLVADEGMFDSTRKIYLEIAKDIHTEEKLKAVDEEMKKKFTFGLFESASMALSSADYQEFENLIKANIRDEKRRQNGELVAKLQTTIRPEDEERMDQRYGDKKGTSLIADILGEGLFDLEGNKGEMLSAFKDVSSWDEYEAIKQKYMDEYGKDLTNELKFFLGEDGFSDLLELIRVNIEERFKMVDTSRELFLDGASRPITEAELSDADTPQLKEALAKEIAVSAEQFESVLEQITLINARKFMDDYEGFVEQFGRKTAVVDQGPLADAQEILGETKNWWEMDNLEKGVGSRDNPEGYDYTKLIRGPEDTQIYDNEEEAMSTTRAKTQGFIEQEKDQAYWNEALAGAKDKGIYDSDLIGYSELESDRISELTDDEIVAILHHSDLERSLEKDSPYQMLYAEYNRRMDEKRQGRYAAEENLPGKNATRADVVVGEKGRRTNQVLPMPSKSKVMSETSDGEETQIYSEEGRRVGGIVVELNGEIRTDFTEEELEKINMARAAAMAMGNPDPFPQAASLTPTGNITGKEVQTSGIPTRNVMSNEESLEQIEMGESLKTKTEIIHGDVFINGKPGTYKEYHEIARNRRKAYREDLKIAGILVEKAGVPVGLTNEDREYLEDFVSSGTLINYDGQVIRDYDFSDNPQELVEKLMGPELDEVLDNIELQKEKDKDREAASEREIEYHNPDIKRKNMEEERAAGYRRPWSPEGDQWYEDYMNAQPPKMLKPGASYDAKTEDADTSKRGREIESPKPTKDVRAIDGRKSGRQINQINERAELIRSSYASYMQAKAAEKAFEESDERGTFKMVEDEFGFSEDKVYDNPEEQEQYMALRRAKAKGSSSYNEAKGDTFEKVEFLQSVGLLPAKIENMDVSYGRLDRMIEDYLKQENIEPRAKGGPVEAGETYLVGEEGEEAYNPFAEFDEADKELEEWMAEGERQMEETVAYFDDLESRGIDPNAMTDKIFKIMEEHEKDWKKASAARKEILTEKAEKEGRSGRVQWEAERIGVGRWTGGNMIQFGGTSEWIRLTEIGDGNALPGVPGWTIQNGYPAKGDLALTKAEGELRLEEEEKADIASGTVLAKDEDVSWRDSRLRVRKFNGEDAFSGEESMFAESERPEYVKNYMKNNFRIKNEDGSITLLTEPRAKGGPVEDGSDYLVGEEGPELMVPKEDGFIVPADATKKMLSGLAGYRKNGGWVEKGMKYLTGEESVEMNIPSSELKSIMGNMSKSRSKVVQSIVPIMMPMTQDKPSPKSIAGGNGPSKGGTSAISYRTKDSFLTKYETT